MALYYAELPPLPKPCPPPASLPNFSDISQPVVGDLSAVPLCDIYTYMTEMGTRCTLLSHSEDIRKEWSS